jgi:modification target Cys-rich repeat protein
MAFCAPLAWASAAQAGVEACGNIHIEASAECEMRAGIACEGHCTPVNFQAQCAADLEIGCRGECTGSASASCTGDCVGSCTGQCEVDPGTFDCEGSCFGRCEGSCEGRCADSECYASCEATCAGECRAQCDIELAQLDCEGQCEASCQGSCKAEANLDCQIDCQARGHAQCQANLEGGCKIDCQTEEGALFCNGHYVDHGGNLKECVNSLRAVLGIEVHGYAEGSCSGNMCSGRAGGSISCAVDRPGPVGWSAVLGLLGLVSLGSARRRSAA